MSAFRMVPSKIMVEVTVPVSVVYIPLVTVAALPVVEPELPVTEPVIGLVTVRLASVPTLVSEELTMLEFRAVPARPVLASMPVSDEPLVEQIRLPPASIVVAKAPAAQSVGLTARAVAVAALPLTEPVIVLVTARLVKKPLATREPVVAISPVRVSELAPRLKLPPETVKPPVAVATVMLAVPSKDTPPMVRAVVNEAAEPSMLVMPVKAWEAVDRFRAIAVDPI